MGRNLEGEPGITHVLAFVRPLELQIQQSNLLFARPTRVNINISKAYNRATQAVMLRATVQTSKALGNGSIAARAGRQWLAARTSRASSAV